MEQDYNLKKWSKGCPNTGINCRRSSCGIEYVFISAALGDDQKGSPVAPKNGSYNNAVVYYEATGNVYLYSSDGVPTRVEKNLDSIIAELQKELNDVEEALSEETTAREAADAALDGRIDTVADNLATETANRISADEDLQADIATETTARQNADTALQNNITAEATNRANADSALQTNINTVSGNLSAEITARQNADTALGNRVTAIEEKIPAQASAQNQLADKDFVNSSVATNTANYISNNGQPFNSLAELEAYSGTLTNNDYAFVVGTDQAGNTTYTRYKYVASTDSWAEEYVLNNSSFTAVQWATINSGITSGDVSKLNNLANIQTIGTNLALTNGELSATDTTYTAGTGLDLTGTQFSIDNTVALKSEIPTNNNQLTNGAGYLTDTDYATSATGGVIRTGSSYGTTMASGGILRATAKTYEEYSSAGSYMFISKGTLENVIDGKGLVDQTDLATKQDKLTAGTNITIDANNVISATGGGSGGVSDVQIAGTSIVNGGIANIGFASTATGGVIRVNSSYGLNVAGTGTLIGVTKSYSSYDSGSDLAVITKGTLENVITGKGLVDQTDLATKQDVLTAGTGISISNNVISATGGGGASTLTIAVTYDQQEDDAFTWSGATINEIKSAYNSGAEIYIPSRYMGTIKITSLSEGTQNSLYMTALYTGYQTCTFLLNSDGTGEVYWYELTQEQTLRDVEDTLRGLINNKQDTLTAGTGISLSNNTLAIDPSVVATQSDLPTSNQLTAASAAYSAQYLVSNIYKNQVGTAFNMTRKNMQGGTSLESVLLEAFDGATASAAGGIGLVPKPAAGDNEKFLKGDGTWATVSGGGASALTITITPDQQTEGAFTWTGATIAEIQTAFDNGTEVLIGTPGTVFKVIARRSTTSAEELTVALDSYNTMALYLYSDGRGESDLFTLVLSETLTQALAGKQDTLTAGDGISITNGVISCTFANGNGVSY